MKQKLLRAWRLRELWLEPEYRREQRLRLWYTLLHVLRIRRITFGDKDSYYG
jgi:hypothetical protein